MGYAGGRENAILTHDHFLPRPVAGFVREQSFDTPQRGERAGHGCPNNYYETRTLRLG